MTAVPAAEYHAKEPAAAAPTVPEPEPAAVAHETVPEPFATPEELQEKPYVSDDFQIGPDGAYEHTEDWPEDTTPREKAKSELINLLFCQIMDLTTMSKIELGDDVITEIRRLNEIIKIV